MHNNIILIGLLAISRGVSALWSCTSNSQCTSIVGGVCLSGSCTCPAGKQAVMGGAECVDLAPYYLSQCVEDHQCSRMGMRYECQQDDDGGRVCRCQEGYHYFLGRCWKTVNYGDACVNNEECLGELRDPFSLKCDGTCQCADDYYQRQKGECRKKVLAIGDACVLDEDCQFPGGICDDSSFICLNTNDQTKNWTMQKYKLQNSTKLKTIDTKYTQTISNKMERRHGAACSVSNSCPSPFECSVFGACVCPVGYYASSNGRNCMAELGSPATSSQCDGALAEVIDGICQCSVNHYYEENMRDCVRVSRRPIEPCALDVQCHTFGAASRCGERQGWFRYCECDEDVSVWDPTRQMCRLYSGIGEECDVDSDCMAGELEIPCVKRDSGPGICTCPEHLQEIEGRCLTSGLELGDHCQASYECTGTENTACLMGVCSCMENYEAVDNSCAPVIGGACKSDSDCLPENSVCADIAEPRSCRCADGYLEHGKECWSSLADRNTTCAVDVQCHHMLGDKSTCTNDSCMCDESYHERDGRCWPIVGLFDICSRSSECYLGDRSEVVICWNGLCQCDFDHPYLEDTRTCSSSTSAITATVFLTMTMLSLSIYQMI